MTSESENVQLYIGLKGFNQDFHVKCRDIDDEDRIVSNIPCLTCRI